MRQVLSDGEFNALAAGRLTAPDGRTYSRRTTRIRRREAAAMVEAARPLIVYREGGELVWLDGDDARTGWSDIRASVSSDAPDPRRGESVTVGRWESADGGEALVLVRHH